MQDALSPRCHRTSTLISQHTEDGAAEGSEEHMEAIVALDLCVDPPTQAGRKQKPGPLFSYSLPTNYL